MIADVAIGRGEQIVSIGDELAISLAAERGSSSRCDQVLANE